MCRDTCRGPFFRFREVAFVMPGNTAPDFQPSSFVMPALVAGIHVLLRARQQPDADSRDEFGDEQNVKTGSRTDQPIPDSSRG
jgi:hypothetical protein